MSSNVFYNFQEIEKLIDELNSGEPVSKPKIITNAGPITNTIINPTANLDIKPVVKLIEPVKAEIFRSAKAIQEYNKEKKFLATNSINISTITLNCNLQSNVFIDKIAKYLSLKENEIVSITHGNRIDPSTNRTIVVVKNKKKLSDRTFFNSITILMKPLNNPAHNYINIKIFGNGSLHATGCKDLDDFYNVAETLIKILKRGENVIIKHKLKNIKFIDSPDKIGIYDMNVRMINSNFKLDFRIDRKRLTKIIQTEHSIGTADKNFGFVECKYKPGGGHSCVNIKHVQGNNIRTSIFVFQTGAIIITGAKNLKQIILSYRFIIKFLNMYKNQIRIVDLDPTDVQKELVKFLRSRQKNKEPDVEY